ncbi:ABCC5 [Bugula neritina]|uniref:ABCC5 n=1 Tax=Bugula neritina TaxID=10212 RepID=A0A7J7KJD8_BUGNE|nr:ABCC5 [Bugula neritina]
MFMKKVMKSFESHWKDEVTEHGPRKASVPRTIVRMMRGRFICAVILDLILNIVPLLRSAYFLSELLNLIETPGSSYPMQIIFLIAICLSSMIRSTIFVSQLNLGAVAGIRVRSGVLSLVLKKILLRRSQNASVGNLVSLCANDGQRLYDAVQFGPFVVSVIPVIGATVYAGYLLGPWGIFGFVIFFAFIFFQVNYTIHNSCYVEIRVKETQVIEKSLRVQSILSAQPAAVPIISAVLTFLAMTLTNQDITVTQAFVFISLLNTLRLPLGITPYCLKYLAEGYSACKRIKKILIAEDELLTLSELSDQRNLVEIRNGYFGWRVHSHRNAESDTKTALTDTKVTSYGSTGKQDMADKQNGGYMHSQNEKDLLLESESSDDSLESSSGDTVITLHGITLSLAKGELLGICGAVGSGKTSIIQAILGMMRKENGEMALNKNMNIAYVPQQAWIMNATVRDNILFGKEFDAKKYWKIVEACALLSDFKQLPAGDQTEIGERGINLSGGQKQRISLARAVYRKTYKSCKSCLQIELFYPVHSDADLFLLDDPLSAVDAHVGQHLFTHCLKDMLKDKTVLFVTHQLQFLTDCDYILVMKDGQIIEEGTHNNLMAYLNGEYSNLIKTFHDDTKDSDDKDKTC